MSNGRLTYVRKNGLMDTGYCSVQLRSEGSWSCIVIDVNTGFNYLGSVSDEFSFLTLGVDRGALNPWGGLPVTQMWRQIPHGYINKQQPTQALCKFL